MNTIRYGAVAVMLGCGFVLTGCTISPDPDYTVIEQPVDAYSAVGQTYAPNDRRYHGTLSTEIQRLQRARRLYELSQQRQLNAVQRRQRRCRQQNDSRLVPIEGTPGEFVYCEPSFKSRPSDLP